MTKEDFFDKFSLQEWELLCGKIEFLEALTEDPFDSEFADQVAQRILRLNSRRSTASRSNGYDSMCE